MRRHRANRPARPVPGAFVDALVEDFTAHGAAAIERLRTWSPERYVQLVAALAPTGPLSGADEAAAMSDEELFRELDDIMGRLDADGALPPFLRYVRAGQA